VRRRRIALGIGANVIDQGAIVVIQLLTVALLVRFWGAERFGLWAMLTAIPAMLSLGDLGFGAAAGVRMTMELARDEPNEAAKTLRGAIRVIGWAALVIVLLVALAIWLGQDLLAQWVPELGDGERLLLTVALAVYAIAVLFAGLSQALLRSSGRFAQGMVLSTLTNVLESGFLFAAAGAGLGLAWAAAAWAGGRLAGVCLQWLVAARALPELTQCWWHSAPGRVRELVKPSLAAMSLPLARTALLQGTVVALGAAAGAALVPAFVAARTLSRIGLQGAQLLTTALMPEFGGAAAQGSIRSVQRMVVLVTGVSLAIAVPFAASLAIAGPWFIKVWSGGQITAPAGLMAIMALSALLGGLWSPLSNLLLAVNRQAEFAAVFVALAAGGVLLTWLTAASLGSAAPALALVLTDLAMLGVVGRLVWQSWAMQGEIARTAREVLTEGWREACRILGRRD
jgi:O-antigen/teichoic acid export membrane protein